ncbi:MAG TPA: discoidin domain-containing protein [Alphaproteobacteria bacterium]|nr:discoidin domain-containing protein [Alphaproteobacteria bacterium]
MIQKILVLFGSIAIGCTVSSAQSLSLAGQWRFELDRTDAGISESWFDRALPDKFQLPGSLPAEGIGDDISTNTPWMGGVKGSPWFWAPEYAQYRQPGNVKVPFWLQPDKYYSGVAWFQRDFVMPKSWNGKRVMLSLERPHWETRVWLDGKLIGTNDSLSTPHEYDFGLLAPGKHTLTIRVDNRMIINIGENSHAITDHTQGNWNGIVGKIELCATPAVWLDDVQVYPNVQTRSALVKVHIGNDSGRFGSGDLSVGEKTVPVTWETQGGDASVDVSLGPNAELWDEFNPALQHLTVTLQSPERDTRKVTFGLREISTDGTQFLINGRKTFIRGTLECCVFPKTGHPPTDIKDWERIIRIAKSYGLNLFRCHSYCPPEAAFEAADELGFYYQIETCWANQSTTIGDGKPVDAWVYRETDRILRAYGNHPSFILMPYGNEPGGEDARRGKNGNYDYRAAFNGYFTDYVNHFKAIDSRRLWTSASGWPQIPANQFDVTPDPRIQAWGAGLKSRINADPPETTTDYRDYIDQRSVPVISHEIGQWCVYPDFDEIPEYTGYLKPKNFEIFRAQLDANGMGNLAHKFLLASGKLQTLCYEEDIESALRTPGMGGFELLGLNDFPGQGTALVGVLNPFWETKGYVTAKQFHRFCNSTVPLARLAKRVFTTDEKLEADLEVAHFGPEPLRNVATVWKLVGQDGRIAAQGKLPARDIPVDNGIALGHISIGLKDMAAPEKYKLVVGLEGTSFENNWNVWVYPAQLPPEPSDVLVTSKFDDAARRRLQSGGKVLLTIPGEEVRNYDKDPVALGFSSIFWNTAWTGRQAPTTLGILCDPKNPALALFPTDYFSDWNWWYLVHRAGALRLDLLPQGIDPIVRVIDDWVTAHPLGLIVEGRVGSGKIVICGFDLTDDTLSDPVSRQMRASLVNYLDSEKCQPAVELSPGQISNLIVDRGMDKMRGVASIKTDSQEDGYEAESAIDGDPQTMWHTSWDGDAPPKFPHELIVEFQTAEKLNGFTALPRQDGNRNGRIKEFAFYASNDGANWDEPVVKGIFSEDAKLKTINFPAPVTAKFVKLVALSGYAHGPWASLAEFNVIRDDK